jgi:hypothetical protein
MGRYRGRSCENTEPKTNHEHKLALHICALPPMTEADYKTRQHDAMAPASAAAKTQRQFFDQPQLPGGK